MNSLKQRGLQSSAAILAILLLAGLFSVVSATTVREVAVKTMLDGSALVFRGKALGQRSSSDPNNNKIIYTYVLFTVEEVIKGDYSGSTIELGYLGGTLGIRTVRVEDSKLPIIGEHGIYFVERLDRPQIHPLYGWDQGHFRITRDQAGVDRMTTADDHPVSALTSGKDGLALKFSSGVARGVHLMDDRQSPGMDLDTFRRSLIGLEKSR